MFKVFWFGYGGTVYLVEELRPMIEELGMTLTTIHEHENADIKWNRLTWMQELRKADIIVLPLNYEIQSAKSNNRLTQSLSLGKPVIASPLPAYLKIAEKYPNSFLIATTKEEWKINLQRLRDDNDLRNTLIQNGLIASREYSPESIVNQWISLFNDLNDKIDIIIPVYNNVEYLKLCIESIQKNTNHLYNLILCDSGSNKETWDYYQTLGNVIVLGKQNERLNYSQACNMGIKYSKTKYFVILNSDVIVSKNWLNNLKEKMIKDKNLAVCGVLSNCDRGWLHDIPMKLFHSQLSLIPGMKKEQFSGQGISKIDELYEFMEKMNLEYKSQFVEREWVAYYAAIYDREKILKVGLLDPKFNNGCEDLDHCIRIKKMGYKIGQAFDCFIFHFGGISRAAYEKTNEKYNEEDILNHEYLKEKWGEIF